MSVWKLDPTGRLSAVCTHQRSGTITHAVYKPSRAKSAASAIASGFAVAEQPPFYFANDGGAICIADDMGNCNDTVSLGMPLAAMLFYSAKEHLVVLTRALVMAQYRAEPGGKMTQVMKVKLSVSGGSDVGVTGCAWLSDGHLATASAEGIVRVWDLADEDNYVLQLNDEAGALANERALSIAYNPAKKLLAVGTNGGRIALWALHAPRAPRAPIDETSWRMQPPVTALDGPIKSLTWGASTGLLAATGADAVAICAQSTLARLARGDWALVQLSASAFVLEHVTTGASLELTTAMRTCGADMWGSRVLLWNGTRAEVYELPTTGAPRVELSAQFLAPSAALALHRESVFMVQDGKLHVANLKGVVRSTLPFLTDEGAPLLLDVCESVLCVCTTMGVLRVWDLSRNEPRQLTAGRTFDVPGAGPVVSVRPNRFGTAVSILTQPPAEPPGARARAVPQPAGGSAVSGALVTGERACCVHVYHVEADAFSAYDFGPSGATPIDHAWDATDAKLLGVLTEAGAPVAAAGGADGGAVAAAGGFGATPQPAADGKAAGGGLELTTLFATADHGVRMQDTFALPRHVESLLALRCPHFLFCGPPAPVLPSPSADADDAGGERDDGLDAPAGSLMGMGARIADEIPFERVQPDCRVSARIMRDFAGLVLPRGASVDGPVREALLAFSFQLTIGNMDEAYKAVRAIKSTSVWENMAKMCVKTRRVDVAEVCLGNMGHVRGAVAVREAAAEPEPEARIAMLAIQLGLVDDAARLYTQCGRHDLLLRLHQAAGRWSDALALARDKDRLRLAATYHEYAKHLEACGDLAGAISAYESAGTHVANVPRLLYGAGQLTELKAYIDGAAHADLDVWWAKLCESTGGYDEALEYYARANDQLARVRVLCFCDRLDDAAEIANDAATPAASYHLARHYEARSMAREAIQFFTRAGRYNQAARLAREHGLTSELQSLSLQAPAQMQSEAASFFEERGQYDKAVQMYHKSGHTQRAIELCFRHELFEPLRQIASSLGADAEPAVLKRCSEFFLDHGLYDKAVGLLVLAAQHHTALELCVLHNIPISEEMAEKMAPSTKLDDPTAEANRVATLLKIAKCCKRQGSYHLATKKYTQAGDKVKAMKCLLKSGDTAKIVYFAGVSRSREIYILGANYLQNLNWHADPEVLRRIVEFYTKAKALEQLASFYEACAAFEMDENGDYAKALDALREAAAALDKSRAHGKDERAAALQHRIGLVERFVGARRFVKTEPQVRRPLVPNPPPPPEALRPRAHRHVNARPARHASTIAITIAIATRHRHAPRRRRWSTRACSCLTSPESRARCAWVTSMR